MGHVEGGKFTFLIQKTVFISLCLIMVCVNGYMNQVVEPAGLKIEALIGVAFGASLISIPVWSLIGFLLTPFWSLLYQIIKPREKGYHSPYRREQG